MAPNVHIERSIQTNIADQQTIAAPLDSTQLADVIGQLRSLAAKISTLPDITQAQQEEASTALKSAADVPLTDPTAGQTIKGFLDNAVSILSSTGEATGATLSIVTSIAAISAALAPLLT